MEPKALQSALATAGYDPGPIDGDIGPKTTAALARAAGAGRLMVVTAPAVSVTTADTRGPFAVPRGVRNNNPGNIDWSAANNWQGKLSRDPSIESRFERFDTPENGIRAICKLLLSYQRKYGLDTIDGLIDRWAPPNENNTASYKRAVANATGIRADMPLGNALRSEKVMRALVEAIIAVECGGYQYAAEVIYEGMRRGLA